MGKLIWVLFTALFICNLAFADEVNLLKNPGFESRTSQWSKTGSSTFTMESAAPLAGTYSAIWDASATGEFFRSSTYTIPAGLKGTTCLIQMKYLWDTGTSGHILMNVDDGTNNVATMSLDPTTSGVPRTAQLNFTCPTSGTVRFELESTANAVAFTVDEAYLGSGRNSAQLSQAELYAGVVYNNAVNCDVSTTSGTVSELADDADCNSRSSVGNAQFVNNRFKMRVAALPKGNYQLQTMLPFYSDAATTSCEAYVKATAGGMPTTYLIAAGATGALYLGNPQGVSTTAVWNNPNDVGQVDFYIEYRRTAGAGACHMATTSAGGSAFSMSLLKFPVQSAEAVTLETSGWRVDANIGGTNPNMGTAAQSSYIGIEDAGLDLVNNAGSGSIAAQIPCSSTNAPTGLTCAAGNESVGVAFNLPSAGDVVACATFSQEINTGAGGSLISTFQLVETAPNAQTIIQEGKSRITAQGRAASTIVNQPIRVCGNFTFSSAGQKVIRAMYEQSVTATINNNLILADRNTSNGQRDIHFEVYPLNQQMPTPVFTAINKKTESNTPGERVERAAITCSTSSTIGAQSGAWLSAIGNRSTGQCTITMANGMFSSAPACVITLKDGGTLTSSYAAINVVSTTSLTVVYSAASNWEGYLVCMGPK